METRLLSTNYKLKTNKQNNKNTLLAEVCNIENPTNNNNNLLDKKIKQLTETPCCHFLTTHFEVVSANCFMNKSKNTSKQKIINKHYENNKSVNRVVINYDNKKLPKATKNVVNQNSVLSKKYNTFQRSFN